VVVKILVVRSISRKGLTQVRNPQRLNARLQKVALLKMIKSDLHGDMQEKFYGEFFARDATVYRS
jgi:hypothetical protein